MKNVWILVCDAARGRLFETRGDDPAWNLLEIFGHADSRRKASDLVSDHSGQRSSLGASAHHNALAPSSDPKEVQKGHFGHALAAMLDRGMRSNRFEQLVLVAPPHFLGMLKNELTPEVTKHLLVAVDKDLTHIDASDVADRLRDRIWNASEESRNQREAIRHSH